MEFIDTHTHLYDEAFTGDADAAVARAAGAGVGKMILPDISSKERPALLDLAGRHPGVLFPCIGLHPTEFTAENLESELDSVEEEASRGGFCAVGEIGMDLYWSKELAEQQKTAFERQLRLAHRLNLPVIIHSREATEPILEILRRNVSLGLRGVFHAYSGSIETCREIMKLGDWHFGIGGVVTFKKAGIAETVKDIPLDRILLETDSPYLTPVPHRGERNESSYIPIIAAKVAMQKGIPVEEVASATTASALKLFRI
ncbi:MAG: TatD family hydrolase [Bacteroidales bacterium]|nr:TatD family hydrolase [Bacteroidales bacterium]